MKKVLTLMVAVMASMFAAATQYQKVTSVDQLHDGDVVVMANETAGKLSGACAGKYLYAVDAVFTNGKAEADGITEITLTASTGAWKLKVGTKTIGNNKSADLNAEGKGSTTYTISFSAEGNVIIANTDASCGTFYYNAGSPRFKTYTSTSMSPIQLYRKVEGSNPVLTLSATSLQFDRRALSAEGTATDSRTLTVSAADLADAPIAASLQRGVVFAVSPASLPATGGTLTLNYTATAEGEYTDTLVVTGQTTSGEPIVARCALSVVITQAAPTGQQVTYNLLQRLDDLHEGDKVFIGTAAKDYVVGLYDYDVSRSNIRGAEAVYGDQRHTVTANDLNAYTVSIDANGKYVLTGSDGLMLCNYNAGKNLSSTETLDNKSRWTITIADDVATIKNVNASGYQILFNKTASPALFCCYSGIDSNTAAVVLYSDNAPAYQEKELYPALEVLFGGEPLDDTLDWGEVVYDDSWGTEYAPYSEMKSLTVVGTDLSETIAISLSGASAFTTYTSSLPAKGGQLSVNFETTSEGTYQGVLTISCGTLSKTIVLKAKAVREATEGPDAKPVLTSSSYRVYLNGYFENELGLEEMDIFYVSASNLTKALYCKWENSEGFSIPSYTGEEMMVTLGDFGDLTYGSSLNLGTDDIDNMEVTVYVQAFNPGMYISQLHFYTYAADKVTIAAEWKVDLVVNITTAQTPDPDPTNNPNVDPVTSVPGVSVTLGGKVLRNGHVLIVREDGTYDLRGQRVE